VKVDLAAQFLHDVGLLSLHSLQGLLQFLRLMDQVQVLLFELGEDHVEVVGVREAQVLIVEVILHSDEVFCEEHLKFRLPVLVVHVLPLKLLELQGVTLFVFVQTCRTACWKCTSKGGLVTRISNG